MASKHETAVLVKQSYEGDRSARDKLFSLVYSELRGLASGMLRLERRGHTLQPTAVVHEAYLRLIRSDELSWEDRSHFLAIAAEAMRHVLVDHARARKAKKRGADWQRIPVSELRPESLTWIDYALDIDNGIEQMARIDERKARVIELRLFGGLKIEEIANVLGVSGSSVEKDWRFARAWLSKLLARSPEG